MRQEARTAPVIGEGPYSTELPSEPGRYVYRLWAASVCIYVGRTGDNGPRSLQVRLNSHRRSKNWWGEVTAIDAAPFLEHAAMATEETAQIRHLRPRYNTRGVACAHDLSQPGAISSTGHCRKCNADAQKTARKRGTERPRNLARRRETDRRRQVQHQAAKRRRKRAPSASQGSLW